MMTKKQKDLLGKKLWEYIQTPEGKEFSKRLEEYADTLIDMVDILGASPYSEGEELERFNDLYSDFILTEKGRWYHEYFTRVNLELHELTLKFGVFDI